MEEELNTLKKENEILRKQNLELQEHLKKYTNGNNHKRYYEKNKEKVKEIGLNYLQKLKVENPEKLKEYRRNYYLKKKQQKLDNINNNKINENILL
jgi:hypothetical protein